MYRPIVEAAQSDDRLRFYHTAHLTHTRRIDSADRENTRAFFRKQGIDGRILHPRISRLLPFHLYMSPNFSDRLIPYNARLRVQLFHGVSFKNCAVHADKTARFDRLFLPGPYHRRRFIERGIYPAGDPRLRMVGLPKLDRLVDGSLDREAILSRYQLDPALPVVLYAPTGDRGNSLFRQGQEIIDTVLGLPVQLIVKPHDHASHDPGCDIDWSARLRSLRHERLRVDLGSDVVPLLFIADLLISDASSVAFEYTLLDRPIVFIDVPEILDGPRSGSMDLDTWGRRGGEIVGAARELAAVIPRLLADPAAGSPIRRQIAADLFFDPGNATRRALRTLYDDLELDPPAALATVEAATIG